jgi:hypothetical protein
MSYCWYCYWGWPKQIEEIYRTAQKELEAIGGSAECSLDYGPGHIVWADENFEREHVQYCLNEARKADCWNYEETDAEKAIVIRSLEKMLELPDEVLDCVPPGFHEDDSNLPETFPPTIEVVRHGIYTVEK